MKVLVCAATKYGATGEIAQAVADVLAEHGCEVTVISPGKVSAVEEFDAVVLGSAVYMGHWMKPARELAERQAAALAAGPVWLFSSGPVGEPAKPADNPVNVTTILQATGARDHQIFTGKLVKKHLSFPDRAMALSHPRPPRATSATGPTSGNAPPASPTPCSPNGGQPRDPTTVARWAGGHSRLAVTMGLRHHPSARVDRGRPEGAAWPRRCPMLISPR